MAHPITKKFEHSGLFVGFEGIDGSGKTTLMAQIFKNLSDQGYDVLKTREPGGTPAGQAIRTLLQHSPVQLSPLTEAFLFAADRAEHMQTIVKPALKEGSIVLSDRTYISSLVYQAENNITQETIQAINTLALQGCSPDLVIYIDIDPEEACKRFAQRSETKTRFEARGVNFFKNVHERYAKLLPQLPNVFVVEGRLDPISAATLATQKICSLFNLKTHEPAQSIVSPS